MKISLTLKQFLVLSISIFIASYLSIIMNGALIAYANTGSDWVSALIQALGNITGGIIGGIVAYLVAAFQIQRQIDCQQKDQIRLSVNKLKRVRHELQDNVAILESILPYSIEENYLIKAMSDDIWKSSLGDLSVSDKVLLQMNVAYRKIILLKLLKEDAIQDDLLSGTQKQICDVVTLIDQEILINESRITSSHT